MKKTVGHGVAASVCLRGKTRCDLLSCSANAVGLVANWETSSGPGQGVGVASNYWKCECVAVGLRRWWSRGSPWDGNCASGRSECLSAVSDFRCNSKRRVIKCHSVCSTRLSASCVPVKQILASRWTDWYFVWRVGTIGKGWRRQVPSKIPSALRDRCVKIADRNRCCNIGCERCSSTCCHRSGFPTCVARGSLSEMEERS
jgi:hypothetical protein